jgi:hypothetical protein
LAVYFQCVLQATAGQRQRSIKASSLVAVALRRLRAIEGSESINDYKLCSSAKNTSDDAAV